MIRTNLATRPFYNERAVRLVLLAIAALGLAATAFNVTQDRAVVAPRHATADAGGAR